MTLYHSEPFEGDLFAMLVQKIPGLKIRNNSRIEDKWLFLYQGREETVSILDFMFNDHPYEDCLRKVAQALYRLLQTEYKLVEPEIHSLRVELEAPRKMLEMRK